MKKIKLLMLTLFIITNLFCAVDFFGNDDYIDFGVQSPLVITGSVSISAWINIDNVSGIQVIIGKAGYQDTEAENHLWMFYTTGDDLGLFWEYGSGTNVLVASDSAVTIPTNTWTHVGVVRETGATSTVRFYVNGVQIGSDSTGWTNATGGADGSCTIAAEAETYVYDFDGEISEIGVWNTVLTDDEMLMLATSKKKRLPFQIQPSNLKLYNGLDDQHVGTGINGISYRDESGNCTNGTGSGHGSNTGEQVLTY